MFTFSKAYAMAGMRIGYALCSDAALANSLRKTTCVFNVPILAQFAAEAALLDTDYLAQMLGWIAAGREQMTAGLRDLGLDPLPSVCNFVSSLVPMNGRACLKTMFEGGIQINTWGDKGYENYIRITIGTEDDNAACLAVLKQVLAEHS